MRRYDFDKAKTLIEMFGNDIDYAMIGVKENWSNSYYYAYTKEDGYTSVFNEEHYACEEFHDNETPILLIRFIDGDRKDFECYKDKEPALSMTMEQLTNAVLNLQNKLRMASNNYTSDAFADELYKVFDPIDIK